MTISNIRTGECYFSLIPEETDYGDRIAVILGCSFLLVLRPWEWGSHGKETLRKFISECNLQHGTTNVIRDINKTECSRRSSRFAERPWKDYCTKTAAHLVLLLQMTDSLAMENMKGPNCSSEWLVSSRFRQQPSKEGALIHLLDCDYPGAVPLWGC